MGLVRGFIGRKPYVAVYAVGYIVKLKVTDGRIKLADIGQQFKGKGIEPLLGPLVLILMLQEPAALIVATEPPQEIQYLFHNSCLNYG